MGMREGFRKITSLVVSLAVLLTLAALTVPTWGENEEPHTNHCVCGTGNGADCDHEPITSWIGISSIDDWKLEITVAAVETMSLEIDDDSLGISSEEDSAEIATYADNEDGIDVKYFYLTNNITLTEEITINSNVTLCLNGKTIKAAPNSRIFTIESSGSLMLCDCSSEKTGKLTGGNVSGNGGAVYIKSGSFTMYGGTISGNSAKEGGGVYNVGTFTMYGGTISDNTAKHQGGGVYNSGTFTMSGGSTISGNEVEVVDKQEDYGGGGVYTSGEFTMSGDSMISGNEVKYWYGGGVCVSVGGVFTMDSGTISKNGANYGGGVYLSGGRFDMTGGAIGDGNVADSGGGGVCVGQIMAAFTMSDGMISGNTTRRGGGVYVSNGTVNLEGGTIGANNASSDGGGVYLGGGAFTMSKGAISDNTSKNGGGAYVGNGAFHLEGGTIGTNVASGNGGGAYLNNTGKFTMRDGAISNNTSKNGGGAYVGNGTFHLESGTIGANNASSAGGGVYLGGGAFTMSDGAISDNTSKNGGGAYVGNGAFDLEGGTIGVNNASGDGGGVYLNNTGKFTMSSGAISNNTAKKVGSCVYVGNENMTLNGKVEISSQKDSNVYLKSGKTITIGEFFSTGGKIGIHPEDTPDCTVFVPATTFGTNVTAADISAMFKADVAGQSILYNDKLDRVELKGEHNYDITKWESDPDNHWHECSKCGIKKGEAKHDWVTVINPATCLEDGSQKDTCKDCGRTTGETKLGATGHDWGEWTPSLTDPDIEISVCNNDPAHTQEREITRDPKPDPVPDPEPDPDPEPPKPSVPTAPPVIRPTVTTVPSGTMTTTVKNTTTAAPPDTTTATTTTATTTTPASAKTVNPKKTTTTPETTASGKTTAKTTTPAADPPVTLTVTPAKADENPKTGVAVSLIPLAAAMLVLTAAVKRNRK